MRPENGEEHEPLIEGLDVGPAGSLDLPIPPPGLRAAVFKRTARVVRARVQRRRLRLAIACSILYGLGLLTGRLLNNGEPAGSPTPSPTLSGSSPAARSSEPPEMQQKIFQAVPADRPRLLRQAGDSYLLSRGDLEGALDCYRQYLEIAPPEGRKAPEAGDTWLLAALKQGTPSHPRR